MDLTDPAFHAVDPHGLARDRVRQDPDTLLRPLDQLGGNRAGIHGNGITAGMASDLLANCRMGRVLRWTFAHAADHPVVCELALTGQDRDYELRVPREWSPIGRSIERFDDALTAFQRHAMIERLLLDAGWVLDAFESERVTIH